MAGTRVEMNSIESFSFYLKHLWTPDPSKRLRFRILDSVLYQDGRPHTWLFTSQKTGEIMRKKGERLQNVAEIVSSFKHKSHGFKGYKDTDLRSKIGIVWFLRSERELSSYLVDEVELGRIMSSHLPEIIAIQVYIGGYHAKGNGIFSHKVWRLRNGSLKHQSYENIDSAIESNLSQFSAYSQQLVVQDFQADILRSFAQTIGKHIEHSASANLEFLQFQVVFDSSWNPYLVAVRDIIFMDAPQDFEDDRNAAIFADGKVPTMPPLNENSLMLPVRISDYNLPSDHQEREDAARAQQRLVEEEASAQNPGTERKKSKWGLLRGVVAFPFKKAPKAEPAAAKPVLQAMQFKNGSHTINIPPPDVNRGPTYFNSNNQQQHPEAVNATSAISKSHNHAAEATGGKTSKPTVHQESVHVHKFVDNPMATGNLIVKDFTYREEKKSKTRPSSASAVLQRSSAVAEKKAPDAAEDFKYEDGDGDLLDRTAMLDEDGDYEKTATTNPRTGVRYGSHRYHLSTALQQNRDEHEADAHSVVGGEKTLTRHLTVRRPISAPHNSRKKFEGLAANRRNVVSLVRNSTAGKLSKTNLQTHKLFDPDVDQGPNPWAGSGLWKDNPITGVTCFGDYCWFYENASKKLEEADRRDKARREGKQVPEVDTKAASQQHLYQAHSVHCPYKLTYKSVLLCRSEIKFLENAPLDDVVDSLLVRQKLADLEDEQLYTYFVRRHVNRVAQKCQEEARKFSVSMPQAPYSVWDDINAVYRRVVYSDALSKVHPSRFYYTVPLCESCYKIYYFLDMQREVTIMHNPEQNAALLDATTPLSARSSRPQSASNKSRPSSANASSSRPASANTVHRATSSRRSAEHHPDGGDEDVILSVDDEDGQHHSEIRANKMRVSKILQQRQPPNISEDEEEAQDGVIFADVHRSTEEPIVKRRPLSASNAVRSSLRTSKQIDQPGNRGSRSHSALPSPKPALRDNKNQVAITRDGTGFRVVLSTEEANASSNPPTSSPKRDTDPKYWLYEQPLQQQVTPIPTNPIPATQVQFMQQSAASNYYLYANVDSTSPEADLSSAIQIPPAYVQQSTNDSTDAVDGGRVKNTYGYYSLPFDKAPYFPMGQVPYVVIPAADMMHPNGQYPYPMSQQYAAAYLQQQQQQQVQPPTQHLVVHTTPPSFYYAEQPVNQPPLYQPQVQPRDTFVEVSKQNLQQQPSCNQEADSYEMEDILSPLKYDNGSHRRVQELPPPSQTIQADDSPQHLAIATPPRYNYEPESSPSSLAPMELSQSFSPFSPLHMASMDFESPVQPYR